MMIVRGRFIPNPHPVFDGNRDNSAGFDPSLYEEDCADLDADIARIILAFARIGYDISSVAARYAWAEHSDSLSAHWLYVPDNDREIFALCTRFLLLE